MRRLLLLLAVLAAGCFKTPAQIQRDHAETLRPASLETPAAAAQRPLRKFKVRAYADEDYRAQTLRWTARIEAQVDRASKILSARFGVALELESARPWSRGDRKKNLFAAVEELRAADSGQGVDWVVGFVSSLQIFTASHEELGAAAVFSRHFVLRGMISIEEAARFEMELDKLSQGERGALLGERRLHKETAVLLHEWAHTLGAFHQQSLGHLLSPVYSPSVASFSPASARVIELGLQWRDRDDAEGRAAWARAYAEEVQRSTEVDDQTRRQALAIASQLEGTGAAAPPAPRDALAGPPESDAACLASYRQQPKGDEAITRCSVAAEDAKARPAVLLVLGQLKLQRDDLDGALPVLARAEAGLLSSQATEAEWVALAQLHGRAQSCSAAERAAAHAPGNASAAVVLADCKRLRSWAALPRAGSGVGEAAEPRYLAAVLAALSAVDSRQGHGAEDAAVALERAYPSAAGAAVVRCYLASRRSSLRRGRTRCEAAAKADPSAVYPRYVLGRLASMDGRLEEARRSFEQALSFDDSSTDVWLSLGAVLARRGDGPALAELKERYRNRFGSEMSLGQ